MSTNEPAPEKRIADDLPVPDHPPVPDPETIEFPGPATVVGDPPQTHLLLEGFDPEEITADFLVAIHDAGDEHGLPVESISVRRDRNG